MKKGIRIAAIASVAMVALSAGGYGAWYAWDNGKIGDNPRAPTSQAMEKAVRMQAAYHTMTTGARPPCVNVEQSSSQPELRGMPGIGLQSVPGQHSVTMLLQTNTRNQQARDIQLAQLDYLAKQGLFTASDTTLTTDDGVGRPARTFKLNWKGYAESRPNYGSSICLSYGKREFAGIEQIEKTLEKMMELDVYEVTYKTTVKGIPAWAATEEAKRNFPKLAELVADGSGKVKVIRTKEGWRSAYELEAEIYVAAKGGNPAQLAAMYTGGLQKQLEAKPTISLDEANKLAAQYLTDPDRYSNAGVACLPLNIQRGGDEKDAQGARDAAEFAVIYYDKNDRKSYEYQNMARTLHILSALEGAGLAEMEVIRPIPPAPPSKAIRRAAPQPVEPPKPVGIRFKVNKEAMTAMGMSGYGGGCIPAGRTKYEVLAVQENFDNTQTNLLVRATIEQTPEWATKIAEQLPALKAILENGLPMNGSVYRLAEGGEAGKWKLSGLNPVYPMLNYETIPSHLVPLMPLTAAAYAAKPIKAPALVPELRSAPTVKMPDYEPPMPAPAPAPPPLDSYQPPPQPYKPALPPAPKKTSSGPLYPADGSPVHVISIYEAPLPGGKRGFQQHPEGVADLSVSEPNATLLLFSYEPVEWRISAANSVKLKRVVAAGYYDQRIVFSGGGKPEVTASKIGTIADQSSIDLRSFDIPRKGDANGLNGIAALTQALTGVLPASFQAAYSAPEAGFSIGANTPKFALPAPRAPSATATAVVLRDTYGGKLIDGNKTLRGAAGAYDEVWTELIYSAGKAFFEGTLRVTGSLVAHSHANIGLCLATEQSVDMSHSRETMAIANSEQRLYKNGDVVGIAADLDNQVMYYHVNGKWQTGAPGSGSGRKLQKGVEYRACFLAAGTTSSGVARGEKQSDTTWEINFGERKFLLAPAGYRPFRGGAVL